MGKIILTIEGSTVGTVAAGTGIVIEKIVSEVDSSRLVAAYSKAFNIPVTSVADIKTVLEHWFDSIIEGSVAKVLEIEKDLAAKKAEDAVTPIIVQG